MFESLTPLKVSCRVVRCKDGVYWIRNRSLASHLERLALQKQQANLFPGARRRSCKGCVKDGMTAGRTGDRNVADLVDTAKQFIIGFKIHEQTPDAIVKRKCKTLVCLLICTLLPIVHSLLRPPPTTRPGKCPQAGLYLSRGLGSRQPVVSLVYEC